MKFYLINNEYKSYAYLHDELGYTTTQSMSISSFKSANDGSWGDTLSGVSGFYSNPDQSEYSKYNGKFFVSGNIGWFTIDEMPYACGAMPVEADTDNIQFTNGSSTNNAASLYFSEDQEYKYLISSQLQLGWKTESAWLALGWTKVAPGPQYTEIDLFQESGAYVNGYVTKSYMPGLSDSNYVYNKDGDTDPSGWSSDNYYYWDFSKRYEFGHYSGDTWVPYAQSLADMPAESTYEPSESVMIRCPSGTNLVYWGRSYAGSGSSTLKTFKCRIYDDAFSAWQNSEHTDQYPWSSGLVTDIPYDSTKIYKILCMLNASGIPVNFTYLYLIEFSNSNGFLKIDISGSGTSERFAKFVFYTKEMPTVSKAENFGDYNWLSTNSGIAENISSGGTSSNLGYIEDLTQILPDYDSTKSYGIIQWRESDRIMSGRTEFGIINSSGKFKVENKTESALNFYQAQVAVCSSSDATIVTVYDSNGNAFNAFNFVMDGVGYYYVLDGIQTYWVSNLSSIGYSNVKPIPPGSYIEVIVLLTQSSTVTFSANDYWSGIVPYNSSAYQDLLDFGVNLVSDGDYRISSDNPDFTFEPLGLFNGSTDLQADMSNFYCAPGPSTSSQYKNYMCIWSRAAYNTPANKWKCRITKNT